MPSSVIRRFDYDAAAAALDVTFVSGRRYRYLEVDADTARGLAGAQSKGRFFNAHIRDHFAFEDLSRRRSR
jgi:lysyl-tRNA synthetase class 2